jgi:hypothetical protein
MSTTSSPPPPFLPGRLPIQPRYQDQVRAGPSKITRAFFCLFLLIHVGISLAALGIAIALIALQPVEAPKPIEYYVEVGVILFTILGWVYIAVIAVRSDNPNAPGWCTFLAILSIFGIAGCALAITIAIAPAQKCDNLQYVNENRLIAGVKERCSLVVIDLSLLWVGTFPNLVGSLTVALVTYIICVIFRYICEHERMEVL